MRGSWLILLAGLVVSGCASTSGPYPNYIAGNYYMVGDSNCVKYKVHDSGKHIACGDTKDTLTGLRYPMTAQQMQMYQMAAQAQAQQRAAAAAEMAAYSYEPQSIQPVQYQPMNLQLAPLGRPGGSQVRCLSTGFYTNCRQY